MQTIIRLLFVEKIMPGMASKIITFKAREKEITFSDQAIRNSQGEFFEKQKK